MSIRSEVWDSVSGVKLCQANRAPGIYFIALILRSARRGRSGHGDEEPMEDWLYEGSHPGYGYPVPAHQFLEECPSVVPHFMKEGAMISPEATAGP